MDGFAARFYPFDERPLADSRWSLHAGPDGRLYAAACCEHQGGETVTVVRYDEARDRLEYLFDMDEVTGDLRDSGRATQCKIHYSFAPAARDGILYAATHMSGPPKGERRYDPWAGWHDPQRAFRGAYLAAFDTRSDRVLWTELMIPKEGCRCLCLDEERGWLYAVTYPRDHLVIYDLEKRSLRDCGRIGSVNTQVLFLDRRRRVHFTDDQGCFLRYDPDEDRIHPLGQRLAHEWYQTGWHGVLYDAVADPAGEAIYMVPWMVHPHLMRFWPEDGPNGRLEDLGPATQPWTASYPASMSLQHVGGLVFGVDGFLYFVRAIWDAEAARKASDESRARGQGMLTRFDPQTGAREDVCILRRGERPSHYISRGARDASGNLYFGAVLDPPLGIFRVTVPNPGCEPNAHLPLRLWG